MEEKKTKKQPSNEYKIKYAAEKFDRMEIVLPKGQRELVREAAKAVGETAAEYIRNALYKRMGQDGFTIEKNSDI